MRPSLLLFIVFLLVSCSPAPKATRLPNGVVVSVSDRNQKGGRLVRAQIFTDDIVRISAIPGDSFPSDNSLASALALPDSFPFQYEESSEEVTLSTRRVTVKIKKASGEVGFFDASGRLLLREQKGGGKWFEPIEVEGTKGYSLRQVFESPEDEAFYGLGQHQSDEFNYKGRNEVLFQYNTKVAVPFIQSSRQYGLLWDNYSLTRCGNPSQPGEISQFTLFDETGQEGALTATYYTRGDTSKVFVKRPETEIDYENLETVKRFPERFNMGNSLITWTGSISPKESGLFNFLLYYAGYTKLFIDGKEVVPERWRTAWNPNTYKFWLSLEKGKKYDFRLEWKPDGGTSYIGVKSYAAVHPAEQQRLSFWSEMGNMVDYYFMYGETPDRVIGAYRTLTGKSQIMPKWAMGYWQSRERYKTAGELLDVVAQYREKRIPLDNIVLDWSYWKEDAWGSHEFDPSRFADPA
ncbi:MAG: TIM-barrel domain-containing protein, partial [Bacteroidales bacterium]